MTLNYLVDTGIREGSSAASVLFVTYLSEIFDVVEAAIPGIYGLSFVDDIGWWADGTDEKAVADKLSLQQRLPQLSGPLAIAWPPTTASPRQPCFGERSRCPRRR